MFSPFLAQSTSLLSKQNSFRLVPEKGVINISSMRYIVHDVMKLITWNLAHLLSFLLKATAKVDAWTNSAFFWNQRLLLSLYFKFGQVNLGGKPQLFFGLQWSHSVHVRLGLWRGCGFRQHPENCNKLWLWCNCE